MTTTIASVEAILVDRPTIRAHQLAMATMQQPVPWAHQAVRRP
jgi:muconate cycloisomerase